MGIENPVLVWCDEIFNCVLLAVDYFASMGMADVKGYPGTAAANQFFEKIGFTGPASSMQFAFYELPERSDTSLEN